ncbi:MAG TPA: hypothetical protein VLG76_07085 [Rhabdochlamydiaceae bacterium]|nr:hypothetical protein [Rhabdochlamydiaceae bacterium]
MNSIPEKSTLKVSEHNDTFTWDNTEPRNYADISDTDWESSAEKVASLNPIRKRKHAGEDPDPLVELDQSGSPLKTLVNLENVGRDQGEELRRALLETDKPVLIEGLAEESSDDGNIESFSSSERSSSSPSALVSEAAAEASNTEEEAEEESKTSREQHTTIKAPKRARGEKFLKKDRINEILSEAFEMFYENGGKRKKGLIKQIDEKYELNGLFSRYVATLQKCVKKDLTRAQINEISRKRKVSYKRVIDYLPKAKLNRESFLNKKERKKMKANF